MDSFRRPKETDEFAESNELKKEYNSILSKYDKLIIFSGLLSAIIILVIFITKYDEINELGPKEENLGWYISYKILLGLIVFCGPFILPLMIKQGVKIYNRNELNELKYKIKLTGDTSKF